VLNKLTELDEEDEKEMVLNTVFFIYLSTLMRDTPSRCSERPSQTLSTYWRRKQPLKWLFLHEKDIPSYLAALRHWLGEGKQIFTSNEIVGKVALKMSIFRGSGPHAKRRKCILQERKTSLHESAVLFPSNRVLQLHDPGFLEMIRKIFYQSAKELEIFKEST